MTPQVFTIDVPEELRGIFGPTIYLDNLGGISVKPAAPAAISLDVGDEHLMMQEFFVDRRVVRLRLRPVR